MPVRRLAVCSCGAAEPGLNAPSQPYSTNKEASVPSEQIVCAPIGKSWSWQGARTVGELSAMRVPTPESPTSPGRSGPRDGTSYRKSPPPLARPWPGPSASLGPRRQPAGSRCVCRQWLSLSLRGTQAHRERPRPEAAVSRTPHSILCVVVARLRAARPGCQLSRRANTDRNDEAAIVCLVVQNK